MKRLLAVVACATLSAFAAPAAQAGGCIKYGIGGAVIGHYAGHHGLLGAGLGCLYGMHKDKVERRKYEERRQHYSHQNSYSN